MTNLNERLGALCNSKVKLAEIAGVSKQSVSNWVARDSISKKAAERIAKHFNVSMEWILSGSETYKTAQLLDKSNVTNQISIITNNQVPLISWVQAGAWESVHSEYHAEEYYPCPEKHSKNTFALTVRGESMSPDFIDGEIIYVDPEVEPKNGSCVVVQQNGDTEATFKQLVFDGSKRYLKALNPNWPNPIIEMLEDAHICGVVIGSYRKRN